MRERAIAVTVAVDGQMYRITPQRTGSWWTHRAVLVYHNMEKSVTLRISAIFRRRTAYWLRDHNIPAGAKSGIAGKPHGMTDLERARFLKKIEAGTVDLPPEAIDAYLFTIEIAEQEATVFGEVRKTIKAHRMVQERAMIALAKELPIYPYAESVHGFGALSLAQIVAEAGDLANYATHQRLWKRMGLAVVEGERQRKTTNKELAETMGYDPERRSIMFNIGDCLVRAKNPDYYPWYLAEKERLAEAHPDWTLLHRDRAAKRHMTKRFLRDLWREWNQPMNEHHHSLEPLAAD